VRDARTHCKGICEGRESGLFCLWEGWPLLEKVSKRRRKQVLRKSRIERGGGVRREEREDAAAEFYGFKAIGGGVERARHDPKLLGAARGSVDHLRMAAGQGHIHFIANQKDGKRARGDGFYRRDFRGRKTSEFFGAMHQRPSAGSEESLAEPGEFSQTGVIVSPFEEIGERGFGDHGFNARVGGRGLQCDASAHGFAKGEEVK
jgi:hypothetical protein